MLRVLLDLMSALEGRGESWKSGHKGGCVNFIV